MKKFIPSMFLIAAVCITLSSKAQGPCPENAALIVNTTNVGNGFEEAVVRVSWDHSNNGKKTLVITVNNFNTAIIDISKIEGEYVLPVIFIFQTNAPATVRATIYSGGNEKKECWTDMWAHFIIVPQPPF